MKIGILGAGAVGYSVASELSSSLDDKIYICAPERYFDRVNEIIIINDKSYSFNITKNDVMDYLIICVKNYDLQRAILDSKSFIDDNTIILPLLNGVTAFDTIKMRLNNRVFYGIIKVEANKIDSNRYVTSKIKNIIFGNEDNTVISNDVKALSDVFDKCKINHEVYTDMKRAIWLKYILNIGINQVSALTNSTYLDMHHPYLQEVLLSLFKEAVSVGIKEGINVSYNDAYDILNQTLTWGSNRVTSLTIDFQNKRKNEIAYFSGALIEMASKHNIDVPVNKLFFKLLKAQSDNFLKE